MSICEVATLSTTGKIYFKGLNGIRAIAALVVVFGHIGQNITLFGLTETGYYKVQWHHYAVTLFFVLSGYLITYLLLEEKAKTNTVSLRGFYMRRILRIWPLYYFIIIVTFLLYYYFPATGIPNVSVTQLTLYSFLLANFTILIGAPITPLSPLWSIGVEEQFYAIWPFIIKNSTRAVRNLWAVIIIYLIIKVATNNFCNNKIYLLVEMTRIHCMAIGGMGALILRENGKILHIIYSKLIQLFCWALFLYSTLIKPINFMTGFNHELYSIVFIIIIINVSTNESTIINLEKSILDFLGKISYGIYMYHMLVIFILSKLIKPLLSNSWPNYATVYTSVVAFTILTAYLSYKYFELPFLNAKGRFSIIKSQISAN